MPGIDLRKAGLIVIDGDRHGGPDGVEAFIELSKQNPDCAVNRPVSKTAGNGQHSFFRQPPGDKFLGNKTGSLPAGIDVRGVGGWVVAPGAMRPDGAMWETLPGSPSLAEAYKAGTIPTLPDTLVRLIRTPKSNGSSAPPDAQVAVNGQGHHPTAAPGRRERAYAAKALENSAAELARMLPNSGRNNKLNESAFVLGRMVACGWIDRVTVADALWRACKQNGLVADGADKVQATLASGLNAGLREPHDPLPESGGQTRGGNGGSNPTVLVGDVAAASCERTAVLVRADSLKPESINWSWRNRFAFGKMAMIAGDPGLGKSTILVEIVAIHSRGRTFPCGEGTAVLCESLILTAEDGLRDTLVPRLLAAEADLTKVHFLTGTKAEGGGADTTAMFDIGKDVAVLRKVFKKNPAIKIFVIDPLTAYLGAGTKAKENTDVRRVLAPIISLAEEFGILLLANNHLNKGAGKAPYRVLNSIAFVALGRIIHLVVADADCHENRKFLCDKSNIGSKPPGLTYIIQKVWIDGDDGEQIETSRISWGTAHIDETADEALGAGDSSPTMVEDAKKFLREVLAKGRMIVGDIEAEARAAGMLGSTARIENSKPFRKACEELQINHIRDGFGPGAKWFWSSHMTTITIGALIGALPNMRAPMRGEGANADCVVCIRKPIGALIFHRRPLYGRGPLWGAYGIGGSLGFTW